MSLTNRRQLENTRKKLKWLEDRYELVRARPTDDEHVRQLTLRSIAALINQLKEEIARFEARQTVRT